jgi:hypothetical protein
VKVRGGASEDSGAEKSALNAITNFCTLLTAATALPPTMQQRLLQHCLASRPYSNVYWDGCLSFVAADAAGVMKPSHFVSQIFTIEKNDVGKGEFCAPSIFFHSLFIIKLTSHVI